MNKSIAIIFVAGFALPTSAAESGDVSNQCAIAGVKLQWKPIKYCHLIENEAKLKATLDAWGWGEQALPPIDWSKDAVVLDSANNPYGNGVAGCRGVFLDADKKSLTLRWGWKQEIVPSASATRAKSDAPNPDTKDKPILDKAKDSVGAVVTDAKQTVKDIVADAKKFPSPIPKRAALLAVFPKTVLASKPKINCVMEK